MQTRPILVIAVVLLCACAGEAERDARNAGTPADTDAATAEPTTEVVQITLAEWSLEMLPDTIAEGPVTFQVHNRADRQHALRVIGDGEEWDIEAIAPGGDATLRVDVSPGLYVIFCPQDDERGNHQALGMSGQLVVREDN